MTGSYNLERVLVIATIPATRVSEEIKTRRREEIVETITIECQIIRYSTGSATATITRKICRVGSDRRALLMRALSGADEGECVAESIITVRVGWVESIVCTRLSF